VLGHEAAARGFDRFARPNHHGDELGALIEAVGVDDPQAPVQCGFGCDRVVEFATMGS
jgi:hypothetical protein